MRYLKFISTLHLTLKGYSLIEVFIVILLISLFLTFIFPNEKHLLQQSNTEIIKLKLYHALQLTRHEAIIRGVPIILCKSANQMICGGSWEQGYIMVANDKPLYTFVNGKKEGALHWRAFPNGREYIEFLSSGFAAAENGTFWYCQKDAHLPSWAIIINKTGRIRVVDANDQLIDDSEGKALSC